MDKELLKALNQVYNIEMENLKEDGVDEQFITGAGFGMKFMIKIVSDCVNGNADFVKEVYND